MMEAYFEMGTSCADLRTQYDVDIHEFVILACINDLRRANTKRIQRAIGLSPTIISANLTALVDNGLVRSNGVSVDEYVLTFDGVALVRKAARS
ncbi:MAG: MarR family transcriptional regulator [Gammaproteobacteria bacterium]|nr:MarR family transcriptional regulator [Gammaproteobacteria bacterium]